MKIKATEIRLQFNENSKAEIVLTSSDKAEILNSLPELKKVIASGKLLAVEVKQYREKRSLDSNSYCWLLIGKIANVLRANQDDIYIEMLKRYGQREPKLLSVVSDAVDMVYRATRNHCTEVGESELNGKTFKHLAILIGSSQYNSKDMSILIEGIVSEAKLLNIETLTPEELSSMNMKWGK
jgi:hypothetical protein